MASKEEDLYSGLAQSNRNAVVRPEDGSCWMSLQPLNWLSIARRSGQKSQTADGRNWSVAIEYFWLK